jgi:hypothetical protein
VKFDPPSIELGGPAREVTVTIRAKDKLSGVRFSGIDVRSPSGKQAVGGWDKWTLVGGTPQDGIWQTRLSLPKSPEPGK